MDSIPGLNEIRSTIDNGEEILEALCTREHSIESDYGTGKEHWEDFLNWEATLFEDRAGWKEHKKKLETLRDKGHVYFEQGYRVGYTARHQIGIPYDIPAKALVWRKITAGHIATSACTRIEYVYQVS